MTKYLLTVTEKQAHTIEQALDLYSRLGIGQFEELLHSPYCWGVEDTSFFGPNNGIAVGSDTHILEEVRKTIEYLKYALTHLPPNASLGIPNPSIPVRIRRAYDISRTIRHRLSWDKNPEGGWGVNFDTPMNWSDEPLPIITKLE